MRLAEISDGEGCINGLASRIKKTGWQGSRSGYARGMYSILQSSTAVLHAIFKFGRRNWIQPANRFAIRKQSGNWVAAFVFAGAIAFPALLAAAPTAGQGAAPDAQRQSLGSLNSAGEVYVNEMKAPSELTIFSGDTVRTGETGTALLTTSADNSFQVSPQSQVVFAADPRYFAELKMGTISVKALVGAGGMAVRAGNSAVVPTNRTERTVATIERTADGSFLVTCSAGSVGVLPMNQAPGLFLQAGQTARISAAGELSAEQAPAAASSGPASPQSAGRSRNFWLYLGLAGAGAGAAAGLAVALSGHAPVSPSAP